jgi:hypothetical protein
MQAYILRETIISMVINSGFSLAFFLLVFGHASPVPVWGIGAYAFDALPQSIAIAVMSTLVPGAITIKRLRSGSITAPTQVALLSSPILPRNIWLKALVMAMLAAVLGLAHQHHPAGARAGEPALVARAAGQAGLWRGAGGPCHPACPEGRPARLTALIPHMLRR